MMNRQHAAPILLSSGFPGGVALQALQQAGGPINEAEVQALVHSHPACLPIAEIDPTFVGPVPICTELNTPAGAIDNFLVTPAGLPVLVECKLWRNPEGRREVVGQILDYAKELSRWSSADLHREVNRRIKKSGRSMLDLVQAVDPALDEQQFNDSLTLNLRRGRFLLLIVGNGIREGVEAIAEYLQAHAGLHFTLGLVEMPFYALPDGARLVVPRILARTALITRTVVALPQGYEVQLSDDALGVEPDSERIDLGTAQQRFWAEFLPYCKLDDHEQAIPKPARLGYLGFMLPAPNGSSWLTVYRDVKRREVGLFLSASRNSAGEYATRIIAADWDIVRAELGQSTKLIADQYQRPRIADHFVIASLDDPEMRKRAFIWLADRVNTFVNVLRPRVRSAVADYAAQQGD